MARGIWVLEDQLDAGQAALAAFRPGEARVLLIESESVLQKGWHRQKLVLLWSAMRHFAAELRAAGWDVDHREAPRFSAALADWQAEHGIDELHLMEPADRHWRPSIERSWGRIGAAVSAAQASGSVARAASVNGVAADGVEADPVAAEPGLLKPVAATHASASYAAAVHSAAPLQLVWHPSNAFLWSREDFAAWAERYRQLRMEFFYRESRRRFGVLIEPASAAAGQEAPQAQSDADRQGAGTKRATSKAPKGAKPAPEPQPLGGQWNAPDAITAAVIAKVERLDGERRAAGLAALPGVSTPFAWGVTRRQALEVLEHFIATRLDGFGPYQDAMVSRQPTLWHSLLSPYLNLGLLHPLAVIRRLESAGLERGTPLASLEGVIRQILGWREYTHGLYHWFGPSYSAHNHFDADAPLPAWLEGLGGSGMACMDTVLSEIEATGYAHHIQRLMILANWGLLAGLNPQAFTAWFSRLFIDGFDWVMQTNVLGMGLFADGGLLASKPYAASGNYIRRMSNYCRGCRYDVKARTGPNACPYNALYWDFLDRHQELLASNPRMALMLRQLERLPETELAAIRATAALHRGKQQAGAGDKTAQLAP
ncbi:MAG: cryptochrome/photolyase family protein [Cyanobacteria bacterium]|nr:cryptochrome/photolyase family protein [Cyanobacteriota bacterium]